MTLERLDIAALPGAEMRVVEHVGREHLAALGSSGRFGARVPLRLAAAGEDHPGRESHGQADQQRAAEPGQVARGQRLAAHGCSTTQRTGSSPASVRSEELAVHRVHGRPP